MSAADRDVPVIMARYTGHAPCPLCAAVPQAGELISKRWGTWLHQRCYEAMTPAQRWEHTKRVNGRGGSVGSPA